MAVTAVLVLELVDVTVVVDDSVRVTVCWVTVVMVDVTQLLLRM